MVAVVKELSPSLTDWNITPSVALDSGPCCTVCTSAAESVVESDGAVTKGGGFEDVDAVVDAGPAIKTAEDVADPASSTEEGEEEDWVG